MSAIKELVKKEEEKNQETLSVEAIKFIDKGGTSTQTKVPNHKTQRLTLRIPTRLAYKINKKISQLEYPSSINQWVVRQLIKLMDEE